MNEHWAIVRIDPKHGMETVEMDADLRSREHALAYYRENHAHHDTDGTLLILIDYQRRQIYNYKVEIDRRVYLMQMDPT